MIPTPQIDFQRTPVTLLLAAVAIAIELVCTLKPEMRYAYYFDYRMGIWAYIWNGEIWRPCTTTLLHGGLLHAGFNVYWLLTFGPVLENRLGSYRFLALVVILAFGSMLPQFIATNYFQPDVRLHTRVLGLSGVIYGLFGILWMGRRFDRSLEAVCNDQIVTLMLFWFVFCIVATRMNVLPVANIAHGAGLAFGALYGLAIFDQEKRPLWFATCAISTALVLASLFYCPGHPGYEHFRDRPLVIFTTASANRPPIHSRSLIGLGLAGRGGRPLGLNKLLHRVG